MTHRPTNVRYVVLFGLCLAAGLAYVHRGCLGVVESTARADLQISTDRMGLVMGSFFWSYALFQIPTGLLVDRWGPRRALFLFGMLGAVTVAMAAATLQVEATAGFVILLTSRVAMGIAQAGLFPASTRAIANWFPVNRRAFASGTPQACMSLGGATGAFVTGSLLGVVSWPWVFAIYAIPGVLWSYAFFAAVRDRPQEHPWANEAERDLVADQAIPTASDRQPLLSILSDFHVVMLCVQQFFRAGANVFWMTWCPTYLQEVHGLSPGRAGQWTAIPTMGVVLGSILGGLVADRVLSRTGSLRASRAGVSMSTATVGVVLFVIVFFLPPGEVYVAIGLLFLASTMTSGGNPSSYSAAMDLGGKNLAAVFGAMNMVGNLGAALFAAVVPLCITAFGSRWEVAILMVGGLYAIGVVCWWPIEPDRSRHQRPVEPDDDIP